MSFLLAHLSDPHLGPLPKPGARELIGKRLTGYLNRTRRKGVHDMDVLEKICADMRAQKPDHIMMTGDALNIGLPAEFPLAVEWMCTLGASTDVSFVPGNHDAYTPDALPLVQRAFAPWMTDDENGATWPYLRERGSVALIGVDSGVATAPFLASGRAGKAQLEGLARLLEQTRRAGKFRVVMIHHPPWRGGATPGRGLRDVRAFERVIAAQGAELIVHGHNHRTYATLLPGLRATAPVVGVASASAVPGSPRHLAAYHLYKIDKVGGYWTLEARVRGIEDAARQVVDLGPLAV